MTEKELIVHLAKTVTSQQATIADLQGMMRNNENWSAVTLLQIARIVGLPVEDGAGPGPTLVNLPAAVQAVVDERNKMRVGLSANSAFVTGT